MKQITTFGLITLLVGCLAGLMSGCKSLYHQVYGNSPLCLAYSSDIDFIRDQSQLSTIVFPLQYGLVIDSVQIITTNSPKFNSNLRSSVEGRSNNGRIIDLLPGEHLLEVTFMNFDQSGSWFTKRPIIEKIDFKPGEVYSLELKITDVAAKLMTFKKTDFNSLDGIVLKPLNEEHKQIIIDYRNKITIKEK